MPQPGDFFVVATPGIMGRLIRIVIRSKRNHAGVCTGEGTIIEADPSGVRESLVSEYDGLTLRWSDLPITDAERVRVVAAARRHLGAPYSWVDDACIALARIFGTHVPEWVRLRLQGKGHLMCSQLVDVCYSEAGIELFRDDRLAGDVTPGDLDALITAGEHAAARR